MYWGITGLGEPIRCALAVGGHAFKDSNPNNDETFKARKEATGQQVPILMVDGKPMGQSKAILKYIGRISSFDGKPLYPTDPLEAYWCDELMELCDDVRAPLAPTFGIADQAEKEAARAALLAEDGKCSKMLAKLDKRLEGEFGTLNVGDIYAFSVCNLFRQPTFIDGFPAGALDKYPNITRHHEWVAKCPPVLAYYADKDGIRTTFKPFS